MKKANDALKNANVKIDNVQASNDVTAFKNTIKTETEVTPQQIADDMW